MGVSIAEVNMHAGKHSSESGKNPPQPPHTAQKKLELVVKCDSHGVIDAVVSAITRIDLEHVQFSVIHSGVGAITKSDLLMAMTGSKLAIGFNVPIMPKLDQFVRENSLEVRIYRVIYSITDDLAKIALSLSPARAEERITGKGRVIQLFKTSPKDSILGCEVLSGKLESGAEFRVISAMGPIYTGRIESLKIDRKAVREARAPQQVGIKIHGFNRAKVGDLVESFKTVLPEQDRGWSPRGEVLYPDR